MTNPSAIAEGNANLRSNDVVLVLSGSTLPVGETREPLLNVMSRVAANELHLMHMDNAQTETFHWPLLLEFRFPVSSTPSTARSRLAKLRSELSKNCPSLLDKSSVYLALRQTAVGPESDGAVVIASVYSWQKNRTRVEREEAMWEHFAMEQREFPYTAVRFNIAHDSVNNDFDFAFQAYVDDPGVLEEIYRSPRLEVMREHSGAFLDVSTRRLAFGRVEIIGLPST